MTGAPRVAARIHVENGLDADRIDLGAASSHYLRNVLRLAPGAAIAVFNARDGERDARIVGFGRDRCTVEIGGLRRATETPRELWLCFAPIKRARLDAMVEKATELGVTRLVPVLTRYTQTDRVNVARLAAIAVAAAEQCERLDVPRVDPPVALEALLAGWPEDRLLVVGDESGGGHPIATALAGARGPFAILTGPEGGFARAELDALARHVLVRRVGLGPRILKADTAAIAALAIVQALAGDGDRPPRFVAEDRDA